MSGTALLRLQNELHARARHRALHALCLMPDDAQNALRWRHRLRGRNHMQQQRPSANLVQHLGPLRLQPRALARGHNGHTE